MWDQPETKEKSSWGKTRSQAEREAEQVNRVLQCGNSDRVKRLGLYTVCKPLYSHPALGRFALPLSTWLLIPKSMRKITHSLLTSYSVNPQSTSIVGLKPAWYTQQDAVPPRLLRQESHEGTELHAQSTTVHHIGRNPKNTPRIPTQNFTSQTKEV